MRVYLMRHGETQWNSEQRLQGRTDIPLCEKGIQLAEETAEGIRKEGLVFDACFSSPLIRAKKTAEIITEGMGLSLETDERIVEISFGDFEGKKIAELHGDEQGEHPAMWYFFKDTANYKAANHSEELSDLFARLRDFWQDKILPLEGKKEAVLVACHGAVCRAFMVELLGLPVADFWANHQFNCSFNIVDVNEGKVTLVEENRIYYDLENVKINPLFVKK